MAKRQKNKEENNDKSEYLSEIIESSAFNSNLNETFEPCVWIRESLCKMTKKYLDLHFPHGISEHGEYTVIGKTRSRMSSSNRITEQLGQVKKSKSKLEICHLNKVYELESYALLNFENASCFKWRYVDTTIPDFEIPTYALRLGYDTITQSVIYAGRTCTFKNSSSIGKIYSYNYKLVAPYKAEVSTFDRYEILCINVSPSSLRHLCRNEIRNLLENENSNIKRLKYYLEPSLISYVKIKSSLKSGSHLRPNQCIISKNGKYKLSLESDGRLLFYINEDRDYLFLYDNVECLWFNELKLVVCFNNLKSVSFLASFENINLVFKDSKLKLSDNGNLYLICPYEETKTVIQFRDDIQTYWNSSVPKFDFFYFIEKNENFVKNVEDDEDDESQSSDESSDSGSSSSDSDSD